MVCWIGVIWSACMAFVFDLPHALKSNWHARRQANIKMTYTVKSFKNPIWKLLCVWFHKDYMLERSVEIGQCLVLALDSLTKIEWHLFFTPNISVPPAAKNRKACFSYHCKHQQRLPVWSWSLVGHVFGLVGHSHRCFHLCCLIISSLCRLLGWHLGLSCHFCDTCWLFLLLHEIYWPCKFSGILHQT